MTLSEPYPPEWFWHPNSGCWWNSRLRRWYTREGVPIEIVVLNEVVPEPTEDVLDRIHLNWILGAALQQHGERECRNAMQELIIESLDRT